MNKTNKGILQTTDEMLNCNLGIYRIYWKSGGSSLAAIGMDREGDRWLAP